MSYFSLMRTLQMLKAGKMLEDIRRRVPDLAPPAYELSDEEFARAMCDAEREDRAEDERNGY